MRKSEHHLATYNIFRIDSRPTQRSSIGKLDKIWLNYFYKMISLQCFQNIYKHIIDQALNDNKMFTFFSCNFYICLNRRFSQLLLKTQNFDIQRFFVENNVFMCFINFSKNCASKFDIFNLIPTNCKKCSRFIVEANFLSG